jgi:hypothetical protein
MVRYDSFDEHYLSNGYVLVNELYEDDERFFKNTWMWGKVKGSYVEDLKILDGLRSNSYSKFEEAWQVFQEKVKKNSK